MVDILVPLVQMRAVLRMHSSLDVVTVYSPVDKLTQMQLQSNFSSKAFTFVSSQLLLVMPLTG
jgi:hypothetical protein